jgi:tRNA/rRNA methyltransferase
LRIVLVRPKEPANIGAAARAMKNFGLHELLLVAPQRPVGRHAYALASHAGDVLEAAMTCNTLEEALRGRKLVLGTTARPRADAARVYTPREAASTFPSEGTAILFGPEDFGLSNEDLRHCQGYIRIPTAEYASLNLAQAVQLVAYEWFVAEQEAMHKDMPAQDLAELPPREVLEGMYAQLLSTLHLIGYTDAQREGSADRLFRAIFDRADLSAREVAALRGLWRQVAWAAQQAPEGLPARRG